MNGNILNVTGTTNLIGIPWISSSLSVGTVLIKPNYAKYNSNGTITVLKEGNYILNIHVTSYSKIKIKTNVNNCIYKENIDSNGSFNLTTKILKNHIISITISSEIKPLIVPYNLTLTRIN